MNRAEEDLLVLSAQSGDQKAFERLYRCYSKSLVRFAYGLCGNETVSNDAVQEAWITLSKSLRTLKDPRGFRLWAYKTTRWRTMDLLRRAPKGLEPLEDEEIACDTARQSGLATSDQLARHLAALPVREKVALTLFYLEELTMVEIAAIEEVPVGTVKSRLNRARSRLKDRMAGDET